MTNIVALKLFNIGDFVLNTLRGITLLINALIYNITGYMYRIFYIVTRARIFDVNDPDGIGAITKRIYVVLGVVMLFVLAISVLRLIADPDKVGANDDKSLKGLAKNTVISIVLIALLPFIYDTIDRVENRILESNIIGNIILMSSTTEEDSHNDFKKNGKIDTKDAGFRVAVSIFSTFFHPVSQDPDNPDVKIAVTPAECRSGEGIEGDLKTLCDHYIEKYDLAMDHGFLSLFFLDPELNQAVTDGTMEYHWLWAMALGLFSAYLFLSFAFDVGARAVKLAVLEIVAPIPIILRITKPTGGIFTKWFNEIKSTYLLVFVRVATIYFAIYTMSFIRDNGHFWNMIDKDYVSNISLTRLIVKAIMYISILQFAKTAPKLLDSIVGGFAKGEWRIGKKLNGEDYEYARRGIGALGTAARNLGREGFNIFNQRNADGTYSSRPVKDRWRQAGRAIGNLPRTVLHGGYRGWQNSGGDLKNLGKEIKKSSSETFEAIDKRDAKRKRFAEASSKHPGNVAYRVPGLRGLALKFDDFSDAIAQEGGPQNYFGNRINYTSVGENADKAGKFRKKINPIVNSDSIQKGVQEIKDRAKNEKASLTEYYNNERLNLRREETRIRSQEGYEEHATRFRKIDEDLGRIYGSEAYKSFSEKAATLNAERSRLMATPEAEAWKRTNEAIGTDARNFRTRYEVDKSKITAEISALEAQKVAIGKDTTLTAEKKDLQIKGLDSQITAAQVKLSDLETEKTKFTAEMKVRRDELNATEFGAKINDIDTKLAALEIDSGAREAMVLEAEKKELEKTDIGKELAELERRKTELKTIYEEEKKEIDDRTKREVDEKIIGNLEKVKDDLRAYMIANSGELRDEFTALTEASQRRILERAGVTTMNPDGSPVPLNLGEEFNKLCQIVRSKDDSTKYTVEELKQIRGFLDGIKEEEVRGAFRAKFVDKIDAAADKAAEGKGGSK